MRRFLTPLLGRSWLVLLALIVVAATGCSTCRDYEDDDDDYEEGHTAAYHRGGSVSAGRLNANPRAMNL